MNSDQAAPVVEDRLELNPRDHVGDPLHHVGAGQDLAGQRHYLLDGFAGARAVEGGRRDHGDGFGMVQLETLLLTLLGYFGKHVDQ
jgi:hypothetical protein